MSVYGALWDNQGGPMNYAEKSVVHCNQSIEVQTLLTFQLLWDALRPANIVHRGAHAADFSCKVFAREVGGARAPKLCWV